MYQFKFLNHFKKQLKSILKKHKDILEDLIFELEKFKKNEHIHLGQNIYKVRINSSNLKKGKSGGFRLLIFIIEKNNIIYPITIYAKNKKESINQKEILFHLNQILDELKNL